MQGYLGLFSALIFTFFFAAPAQAATIWELHSELVRLEQESDVKLIPVVEKLTLGDGYDEASFAIAQNERYALDHIRHELAETFLTLDKAEQRRFIASLAARPVNELLYYDFPPFRDELKQIAAIRAAQKALLSLKYNLSGRNGINQKTIQTGEIEVSPTRQVEINGNSFPANHFSLTFDDGPRSTTTESVLKTLESWKIKANFFVLGQNIEGLQTQPINVIRTMHEKGHGVESHSWSHPQFTKLDDDEVKTEVNDTHDMIEFLLSSFQYTTHMFRFPYGARNSHLKSLVNGLSYTSIMWNIDTLDWKYKNPDTIVELTEKQIERRGKGIILMHDIHTQTTLALPPIIQILADKKSTVVRLKSVE